MESKFKYRSKGSQFGFRIDGTSKLMFSKGDDTPVDEKEAVACESYVASGMLERTGANPLEGKAVNIAPTKVKGPGGEITEKTGAPNFDARAKVDEPTKPATKGK